MTSQEPDQTAPPLVHAEPLLLVETPQIKVGFDGLDAQGRQSCTEIREDGAGDAVFHEGLGDHDPVQKNRFVVDLAVNHSPDDLFGLVGGHQVTVGFADGLGKTSLQEQAVKLADFRRAGRFADDVGVSVFIGDGGTHDDLTVFGSPDRAHFHPVAA